jgi:hypothetical protein
MEQFDRRIAEFEMMWAANSSTPPKSTNPTPATTSTTTLPAKRDDTDADPRLLREKEAQIEALAEQVRTLKLALEMSKRTPDQLRADEEEAWRRTKACNETYEHLLDDELPELPPTPVPLSDTVGYKNYMRLRYEYQRRGLLEVEILARRDGGNTSGGNGNTRDPIQRSTSAPSLPPAIRSVPTASSSIASPSTTSTTTATTTTMPSTKKDFDPSSTSRKPIRQSPAPPSFHVGEYVEALCADDGFYYVAEVQQMRGRERITIMVQV